MNIVLLDSHTLSSGDLSWQPLEALGNFTHFPRVREEDIPELAAEADILLTNKAPLTAQTLALLPRVKFIAVTATGFNNVDTAAARLRGISVANAKNYSSAAVAQHVFSLILHFTNDVGRLSRSIQNGEWAACPDFCYTFSPLTELAGKTLGLVGFGNIAQEVGKIANAFGMKVLCTKRSPASSGNGVVFTDLETVFRQSDFVSLHCPLTPETQGLINKGTLSLMKPSAVLINTGRGPLVDEPALAEALNTGRIAGAGLDVLSAEPPPHNHPLFSAKNCVITPHVAWIATEARQRLLDITAKNIKAFLAGESLNVVN